MNAALREVLLSLEPLKLKDRTAYCPITLVDYWIGDLGNLRTRSADELPSWDADDSIFDGQYHYANLVVDTRGYDVAMNAHRLIVLITRITSSGDLEWVSKAEANVFIQDYLTHHNLCNR